MAIGFDDPITADFASRNEVEEEEEAACDLHLPDQYTVAPDIQVRSHDAWLFANFR